MRASVPLLFMSLASSNVQILFVDVESHPDQYFLLLLATRLIHCIDEKAPRIRLWTQEDGLADMVGRYVSVREMRIDKTRVEGTKVFHPEEWPAR
jgi:hypothetical protein